MSPVGPSAILRDGGATAEVEPVIIADLWVHGLVADLTDYAGDQSDHR